MSSHSLPHILYARFWRKLVAYLNLFSLITDMVMRRSGALSVDEFFQISFRTSGFWKEWFLTLSREFSGFLELSCKIDKTLKTFLPSEFNTWSRLGVKKNSIRNRLSFVRFWFFGTALASQIIVLEWCRWRWLNFY